MVKPSTVRKSLKIFIGLFFILSAIADSSYASTLNEWIARSRREQAEREARETRDRLEREARYRQECAEREARYRQERAIREALEARQARDHQEREVRRVREERERDNRERDRIQREERERDDRAQLERDTLDRRRRGGGFHLIQQRAAVPTASVQPMLLPSLIELKITHMSLLHIFKLPDGSEVHTNSENQVWVKEPSGPGFPATPWDVYAQKNGLNIITNVQTGDADVVELRIMRGSQSFLLPGGYEISINRNDEVWVKEPGGPGYYATPYQSFASRVGLVARPVITNPIELRITRVSPLYVFNLPDGSEVHTNNENQVWVKEPGGPGYPAAPWDDYAKKNGLSIITKIETGDVDAVELCIKRMNQPFLFPGGYQIAVNGNDEVWVKEPGQGYYATPYQSFASRVGLAVRTVLSDEDDLL